MKSGLMAIYFMKCVVDICSYENGSVLILPNKWRKPTSKGRQSYDQCFTTSQKMKPVGTATDSICSVLT